MSIPGAGGTRGGIGSFLVGIVLMVGGGYLLLHNILVVSSFGLGTSLYHVPAFGAGFSVTGGLLLVPLILGIGLIFYNRRNPLGWLLAIGTLGAIVFGVLANLRFTLRTMSLFDLLLVLGLLGAGAGLFLRSLRDQ